MCANERPRLRTEAAQSGSALQNKHNSTTPAGQPSFPIEPLLSMEDLRQILGVSRSKLERLRAAGKVPPADLDLRTISKPIPRWKPETIRKWIAGGGRL
jgi:hypothetical protein